MEHMNMFNVKDIVAQESTILQKNRTRKELTALVFRWMDGEKAPGGTVARLPSVHEQEDGTILAVCATGSSSRDSLLSWVRRLEV